MVRYRFQLGPDPRSLGHAADLVSVEGVVAGAVDVDKLSAIVDTVVSGCGLCALSGHHFVAHTRATLKVPRRARYGWRRKCELE